MNQEIPIAKPMRSSTPDLYICGTVVHFKDGGLSEINVLHTGTKEACESVSQNTHAIAYSGTRPFAHAQCFVMKIDKPTEPTEARQQPNQAGPTEAS